MAVSPERHTNQPLSVKAKDAIGKSNLIELLKRPIVGNRLREPFCAIHRSSVQGSNVEIPTALISQLGLESLDWTQLHNNLALLALTALYIGKPREILQSMMVTPNTDETLATIEIARRVDLDKGFEDVVPFFLRIAGVDKEQNRIIAATYDLTDSNRLVKLNVSVPNDEYGDLTKDLPAIHRDETTASIPTNKDNPYETAGLITEVMCGKVHQNNVLILRFDNGNSIVEPLGYFIERGDEIVTVGLREDAAKARDLKSWKISVPAALSET